MTRPSVPNDRLQAAADRRGVSREAMMARSERAFIMQRYDGDRDRLPPGIAACVRALEETIIRG